MLHLSVHLPDLPADTQGWRAFALQAADLAIEQERARLARELHDGLGRYVDVLGLHVEAVAAHLASQPDLARASLQRACSEVVGLRQMLRQVLAGVLVESPPGGLVAALAGDLHACEVAGLDVRVEVCGLVVPLAAPAFHGLYRIAQEALTNVRRHAFADRVVLEVDYRERQRVSLVVADNGRGFDPRYAAQGRGLINVRERAALLGGACEVQGAPGQGVTIRVTLPCGSSPAPVEQPIGGAS